MMEMETIREMIETGKDIIYEVQKEELKWF
jgi:hypothetical protein